MTLIKQKISPDTPMAQQKAMTRKVWGSSSIIHPVRGRPAKRRTTTTFRPSAIRSFENPYSFIDSARSFTAQENFLYAAVMEGFKILERKDLG